MKMRALTWLLVLTFVLPAARLDSGGALAQDDFTVDPIEETITDEAPDASPEATESEDAEESPPAEATETETAEATATDTATVTPDSSETPETVEPEPSPSGGTPAVDTPTTEAMAAEEDPPVIAPAEATPADDAFPDPPALAEIQVTLYCTSNAELTRIDNLSADKTLVILSVGSMLDASASEPHVLSPERSLGPGRTVIFRSNSGATYGTILTTDEMYTDDAYDADGAIVETSAGQITQPCAGAPPPTLSDIQVTLNCRSNPELTRIDNLSAVSTLVIESIGSLADQTASEPYLVDRKLGPGRTVIYRSNSGAAYGTILTTNALYTDGAWDDDGAVIVTNAGTITTHCEAAPPPSLLSIGMTCNGWPEKTTIENVGLGPVTLHSLWTTYNQQSFEPISLNATLNPGQTIVYQSGGGATANKLSSTEIYSENAGTAERLYVKVSTGKTFNVACPPGPKWIEVNLSTQYLTAWEGQTRIAGAYTSTGKDGFWTPTGTFYVNTKLTSQTMAGCIQGECYNVPNVPWVMYFTNVGHAIHGAYWHDEFGVRRRSHGCVNLPVSFAEWLYWWTPMGTRVVIHY